MSALGEFTVRDVARLLELQEARLRYWAQTGFVGPSMRKGGKLLYTFQDLIGVKVAKELLDKGLSLQAARKALESLRATLPHVDRPLAQLRIVADGERVVVADEDATFEATSGQLVMSFAVEQLEKRVAEVLPIADTVVTPVADASTRKPPRAAEALPPTAYAAFQAAAEAHTRAELARAEKLYRRAVELDPALAAAWTNLATLAEGRGARGEAREHLEKALALEPDLAEARYNLANILADVGELDAAIAEYRRAVAADPDFADAHFNLALALARTGQATAARTHAQRYLELDPDSEWAQAARDLCTIATT